MLNFHVTFQQEFHLLKGALVGNELSYIKAKEKKNSVFQMALHSG